MTDQTFLEQFSASYKWETTSAKRRFRCKKYLNRGMIENHRLALTLGGVVDKSLNDNEGLQSSDYSTYQIFEKGDLVFKLIDLENIRTSRVGYVPRRGIMSPAYIRLRPELENTHSRYYYWFFYGTYVNNIFNGMGGGVRQNLTPTDLLEFPIPLPNLETQKAIASFLDRETARIDQLIEKKQLLIGLLIQKKNVAIAEIVKRGLDTEAEQKDSGELWLGKVPVHWKPTCIKHLFRQAKRQGFPNLTVLSVYREFGVIIKSSRNDNINKTPEDVSMYQLVNPGDLVINKMKAWQGSLGVSEHKGITSPDYVVFKPTNSHYPRYIHHFLRAQPMPTVYRMISNGIRIDQWRLEPDKFRNIPIFLPDYDEQVRISKHIDQIVRKTEKIVDLTKKSIEGLTELRTALITAAVTGQIDFENWSKIGEVKQRFEVIEGGRNKKKTTSIPSASSPTLNVLVAAEIVRRHQSTPKFGRVKLQKILYLAETHAGIDELNGNYTREAAGPLDRELLQAVETGMADAQFYRTEANNGRDQVKYTPLSKAKSVSSLMNEELGEQASNLSKLITLLRDEKTKSVEAIATLYAVWNDVLLDNNKPVDKQIIHAVLNDWHPEKQDKFSEDKLQQWLNWMRRHDLVPTGRGPKTHLGRLL